MPFKSLRQRESAVTPTTSKSSSVGTFGDSDGLWVTEPRRYVRFTDRKLVEMATRSAGAIDWSQLMRRRPRQAKLRRTSSCVLGADDEDGYAVTVARTKKAISVRSSVVVACTEAEIHNALRPLTNQGYAATMRELYGPAFIYGAVVHQAVDTDDTNASTPAYGRSSSQEQTLPANVETSDVVVKTATFVRRHALARSEEWCFVEALHTVKESEATGFAVSLTSLHPDNVFIGKTKANVSPITDVTVTYAVVPFSADSKAHVQVTFLANFDRNAAWTVKPSLRPTRPHYRLQRELSERGLVRRLKEMASATQQLGQIVRRRRLSAQVFVDIRAFRPPNSRCICCTRRLIAMAGRKKKHCYLCGLFMCEQCSFRHNLPSARLRNFVVRICGHCMDRVDDGNYNNLPSEPVSPPTIQPDESGAESSVKVLGRLLGEAMVTTSPTRKTAVKTIIRYLSDGDDSPELSSNDQKLSTVSSDGDYLEVLRQVAERGRGSEDSSYELANSSTRSYALSSKHEGESDGVFEAPIPSDEQDRIDWVDSARLSELKNHPELEVICDLARQELDCQAGLINVMAQDEMHVMAASDPGFRDQVFPREQVFCAHTIMDKDLPLLVPHPEADVRFSRQAVVKDAGLHFYFGFPLKAGDTVVGTFCCVDAVSRKVTQTQYAAMAWLAQSASRVLQQHGGARPSAR